MSYQFEQLRMIEKLLQERCNHMVVCASVHGFQWIICSAGVQTAAGRPGQLYKIYRDNVLVKFVVKT